MAFESTNAGSEWVKTKKKVSDGESKRCESDQECSGKYFDRSHKGRMHSSPRRPLRFRYNHIRTQSFALFYRATNSTRELAIARNLAGRSCAEASSRVKQWRSKSGRDCWCIVWVTATCVLWYRRMKKEENKFSSVRTSHAWFNILDCISDV